MVAKELFRAGKVREAAKDLAAHLREHPADTRQRTFLFELLCFSGEYERAEKQLGVLADGGDKAQLGAMLYYSALHAEKIRHELFQKEAFPITGDGSAVSPAGAWNGKPFQSIQDADPDIGPRLEVYAAGAYLWIPFKHLASVEMEAPQQLRDTLWSPAFVRTGPSFKSADLGQVLIPVIYPFSWKHPDENVWLGRATVWGIDDRGREYPAGQKLFVVDGEEVPLLELRSLQFTAAEGAN